MSFLTSIRGRLLLLVLLLIVPATLLVYKTALDNRELQLAEARARLLGIARAAAADLQGDIRTARQLGFALSQVPALRDFREPECSALLASILATNDHYANATVMAADGAGRCSGRLAARPLPDYADRAYFREVMKSGRAVVDRPTLSRVLGKPVLPVAAPIRNSADQTAGVIVLALDLDRLGQLLAREQPLPNMVFQIWDDQGTLLFRYPDAEKLAGKQFADAAPVTAAMAGGGDGTLEVLGFDGQRRVFGFAAPAAEYRNSGLYMGVNVPAAALYAVADALVTQALWIMAAIALLGLAAAWFIGKCLILRQVKDLSDFGDRLELALDAGRMEAWELDLERDRGAMTFERPAQIFSTAALRELSWESFIEHVLPEDRQYAQQCFETVLADGRCEMTVSILRPDGEQRWISVQGQLQRNARGQPEKISGVMADVTEQCRTAQLIAESEKRYRGLLESAADGIVICDGKGRIVMVNQEAERLFGYSREELIGQPVELLVPEHLRGGHEHDRESYQRRPRPRQMGPRDGNCFARRKDGSIFPADISLSALNGKGGTLITAMVRDITAREKADKELKRLNRTLHLLSECNQVLVRAKDEAELLATVCRHVVDDGGYRMAWVGFARQDAARSVDVAAHAGVEETKAYVESLQITWADEERGRGPTGTAIREARLMVARNIDDPRFQPWREAAKRMGISSVISLPLKGKDGLIGALSIYAAEADAFDDAEIKLLVELADDLAYGIVSLGETALRERFERELDHKEHYDTVTGLANRSLFLDRLGQSIIHDGRAGRHVAVLLLDLDRFKAINENLGHEAGDSLLREIGRRLTAQLRDGDTVARLSADEFGLVVSDLAQAEDVAALAHKLLQAIAEPLTLGGGEVFVTGSVGISVYPRDGESAEALLSGANAAMESAKNEGGNTFRFFAAEMNQRTTIRFALAGALRRALEHGELQLHYQPKVNLASGAVVGAEALARWTDAELGVVSPADFIPLAEETGLILPLGEWALDCACRQMRAWLDAGLAPPPLAVNLSARQFRQENLEPTIRQALQRHGLEPGLLELEITESTAMIDVERAVTILRRLKAIGVKLSIDDFGTGYSSLSYLKRFPIDHLKIDRAFVSDITTDPDDAAICIAVIGLAHSMKMTVIAEGVETEGQMNYLRQHRCDEMQGYYFSRPLPAAEYAQLLAADTCMALPAAADGAERQRTLLLVDDEANILSALKRLLRRDGYRILTANNAAKGFALLATHEVQVILADQRMPTMSGTEFLSRVRDLYPETIRIVLSGYTDLDSITEAVNRGSIYKFLTKPWDDEALREQLHQAFLHHEAQAGKRGNG